LRDAQSDLAAAGRGGYGHSHPMQLRAGDRVAVCLLKGRGK